MRRSVAVFLWLVTFPFTVSALGLGDISLNSALNQPFAAEIPVESYTESDLKGLKVTLASEATFARYGLDRPAFLQDFDFSVDENAGGSPVVSISSARPVAEPFVTLLLDIRWSAGRLLREYTVLLDPPLFESEPVQTAVTAPAVTPAESAAETGSSAGQVVRAAEPAPAAPVRSPAPAPAPVAEQSRPAEPAPASQPAAPALSGSYSVQRRDTLWGIASRVRGDRDLTVNQVMLALYRANPEAFLGNINRLKAGAILRVPEESQFGELTPAQATSAVREQNAALRQPAPVTAAAEPARLTLVAPEEQGDAADTATADAGPAGTAADAEQALDAAARGIETEQLRGRIGELESELSASKRLIEARDAELAALQRRIQVLESRGDETVSEAGEAALADDGVFVDTDTTAVDAAAEIDQEAAAEDPLFADEAAEQPAGEAEPAAADEAAAETAAADAVTSVPAPVEEPSFVSQLLGNLWFWVSAGVVLLLALFVARRRQAEDVDDDFAAEGTGGDWEAAAADADHEETIRDLEAMPEPDASIVVEESEVGDGFPESETAADPTAQLESLLDIGDDGDEAQVAEPDAAAEADADKTTELTAVDDAADKETPLEKTISTGPLNLDQADPVAEAEFHMAYGLYDQAAELLEAALKSEPDNRGYLVKLIEVFFVWENRDGFLRHATALREAVSDDSDSDWNKVVILGKQLCPDEEIFSGAAAAAPTSDVMDFELSDDGDDAGATELDFTLAGADMPTLSEDAVPDEEAQGDADADLDFDLGGDFDADSEEDLALNLDDDLDDSGDTLESPTVETDAVADEAEDAGADTLETPTIESPAVEHGEAAADAEETAAKEVDLDLGEELIDDSAATMETPTIESPMNEPTLESPTLETAGAGGDTTEMPALDADSFDSEDIDLDLGGADDLDVDLSGLSDTDDTGATTQLSVEPVAEPGEGLDDDDATLLADVADGASSEAADDEETLVADSADLEAEIDAEIDAQAVADSDTVEQPKIDPTDVELGDTAEQPAMIDSGDVDFDLGMEAEADDDVVTAIQEASLPEDATMTEVGTKLDLARAYIDMGDPDGARSILSEVLDEGAEEQQQEARQLLEELGD